MKYQPSSLKYVSLQADFTSKTILDFVSIARYCISVTIELIPTVLYLYSQHLEFVYKR